MTLPNENTRSFRLYVTHVDGDGHFLKISGQLDQQSSLMIESLFDTARDNLESGIGTVAPAAIKEGILCAAKYKDGTYYRAKIINTTSLSKGLVGVHFIDYGNKDIISLSTIRFLENYDSILLQMKGLASDYYLSRVIHPSGRWEEPLLMKLQSLLCYAEYTANVEAAHRVPLISIQFKGNDLSTHLVSHRYGIALPLQKQEMLLLQMSGENQQTLNWQPNYGQEVPYTEPLPFVINQNFPSNPASAMRLQQNSPLPYNGSVPPPSLISHRLLVNKVSRNPISLKAPVRQPQHVPNTGLPLVSNALSMAANKPASPKKSSTYKSKLLEVNSQHKVFISYSEEGPELFAAQLASEGQRFQDMMEEINRRPHSSLTEPPMIGTVCLGRMSGDRMICRAIVMNLSGSQCKLFFVDFGDTEMVSYYDIFDIPQEFVKPNVFALRFCLSGVKKLEKGPHLNEIFKQLVNGKVLTLNVVPPEGPPLIQYGELYLDNQNVLDLLMANLKDKLQFKWMDMLTLGTRKSVLVSYVDSCVKFYIQLSDKIDDLNAVMNAVKIHCESTSCPGELPVGAACCAKFPDDDKWYRALIKGTRGKKVVVAYVDYGNEQEVEVSDLRTIVPDLIRLPAQAMKCALKGFESRPVETKTSNQLEMLALEKTLMTQIVGMLSNDTMLVSLVDDTVSPPLDVARRMTQLSQPRSNTEAKATTPVRKDAPDSFSSPEGSEGSKKSFRREKSFKEERRPPREANEDFAPRGSSFRSRENKEPFDRSATGRHSDKFGGRPDKGDRRGGKPWESREAAPAANDDWEETPAAAPAPAPAPSYQPRQNRDFNNRDREPFNRDREANNREREPFNREREPFNREREPFNREREPFNRDRDSHREREPHNRDRDTNNRDREPYNRDRDQNRDQGNRDRREDRRKPRPDQHDKGQKPTWKGKEPGAAGKRLRQAAEAATADTSHPPNPHRGFSVQDRLKRDNKFNQQDEWEDKKDEWGGNKGARDSRPEREEKKDDWGGRGARDNRPERRDNRGDKRDTWGDKKENFQKREFRDNNRERGDRGKSNFTPRDRAERSFGSDGDKRSEKSFRSQDSGGRAAGRAPPYKSRSKFTQVQYKELTDPVALETEFIDPTIELNAQHEIAVTWIISPENFYTQIMSLQPQFLEMMHKIPELYKGVKSYEGMIPVGASVLARYPADGVLYRATVVSVQPFSKFIVRYVDFGNKQLVDAKDIWQLDRQLLDLPKMAIHCSLLGVSPKDGEWKADPEIDLCFNAPRYQCVFSECVEGQWRVSLWNNGASVADLMVEKQLAVLSEHQSAVSLKDEAIDLTIIVGQQILCRVTHVESFEKFYVQLDLDKTALVESAIADYDVSKLAPLAADSLTEGNHCTVKHEDKIYRAILTDVADTEHVQAVLPDYGMTINTSMANLMILPTELSVYYYQSLESCFNNFTSESKALMTVEELKEKLTNKKFIIYINSVEGISLMSTLYELSSGHKVAVFEPDEGAYDEVVPLCSRAVFNYNFGMSYVSHGENLNEFYLQRACDSDRLGVLLEELYQFYEEGTPEPLTTFEVDTLCIAKSSDGNWYRGIIVSTTETDAKVQFSDYGNSETLPKDSLKVLDSKFFEPCALALVASLGLVALQDDALAKLIEWTTDKEVQVTLAFGTDGWLANLHLDGVDLSMKLVNEKLATPKLSATSEEPKAEPPAEEPVSMPEGCTQVYISHIDTPGHFWLQMSDKIDSIEEIQTNLQVNADKYENIESREMGTLCIAKYLADDQWYRAEILDSDSDITTVRFIDYGNTDVLDNQPGLLKTIPDNLKEVERYALKSSVNAVPTGTGEWSEPASEFFTQLVGDLTAPVDALIVLKDVTTYVDIFVNGQNLTDKLVSEGYAARSDETECGDLPSCFASHINSPSEFWIQLETAAPELQAMEAAMVDAENFPELKEKEEGVICAAKYPEDGSWYRAQVIVDGSEGTEVLFMDYGNASITNELRSLPDELKAKPALSRKCALQKARDIKSWSRKSEEKFNELAAEGATIFNVQFIASGDISIVELYLEGKSVTEELVGLCEEHPASERPTPVGQDLHSTGKVCYVNSIDEFYVQLDDSSADVDKILERLGGAADFESISELKVGSICASFWDEDEQWYRAKVLEFCDVGYHVQFIDYGNKAKCTEFRQLPEDLAVIEPTAKCCRLAVSGDSKVEAVNDKLNKLAADVDSTFQIHFLDSTKEPALVKLLINEEDIVSIASLKPDNIEGDLKSIENDDNETGIKKVEDEPEKEVISSEISESSKDEPEIYAENTTEEMHKTDTENEASERNISLNEELNESIESSNTVIENKSFEAKTDDLCDDVTEGAMHDEISSPQKNDDASIETLEYSNETIKTPERDDSINTDTGYISGDQDKSVLSEAQEKVMETKEEVSVLSESTETSNTEVETENNLAKTPETKDTTEIVTKLAETPYKVTETSKTVIATPDTAEKINVTAENETKSPEKLTETPEKATETSITVIATPDPDEKLNVTAENVTKSPEKIAETPEKATETPETVMESPDKSAKINDTTEKVIKLPDKSPATPDKASTDMSEVNESVAKGTETCMKTEFSEKLTDTVDKVTDVLEKETVNLADKDACREQTESLKSEIIPEDQKEVEKSDISPK